ERSGRPSHVYTRPCGRRVAFDRLERERLDAPDQPRPGDLVRRGGARVRARRPAGSAHAVRHGRLSHQGQAPALQRARHGAGGERTGGAAAQVGRRHRSVLVFTPLVPTPCPPLRIRGEGELGTLLSSPLSTSVERGTGGEDYGEGDRG